MDNRVMPHDTDAEKVVLGTIMSDRNALNEVREILSPNCFYDNLNNQVYKAIIAIDSRGESPDLITVTNEMRKKNESVDLFAISQISSYHTNDIYQHAALLHDKEKGADL